MAVSDVFFMTVLERSKSGATMLRRRRDERPGRVAEPMEAHDRPVPAQPTHPEFTVTRHRRTAAQVPQDSALYTCQCGYVFEAAVSTSVGCPHCGGAQAW
jgi:hypothetical protein